MCILLIGLSLPSTKKFNGAAVTLTTSPSTLIAVTSNDTESGRVVVSPIFILSYI